ncbi:hypothetical protein EW146_g5141 [Bondarzewia mesenterica]|uniref:Maltose/galactoside acetyltransferase domain-containing protein n=1 Tax=Bondarzewia mesenterica TaxID=1095465 RepID=A0A4S4LU79_9AGAM|nr:hypothetical protein EW146_g5141 [Bondarzewia mesenterica]
MPEPSAAFVEEKRQETTPVQDATAGLTERQKMEQGLPYLAMADPTLIQARLRARGLIQRYNTFPWPTSGMDYFGPDERRSILAQLFNLTLEEVKTNPLEIEPPFYCDYGDNITFNQDNYWTHGFADTCFVSAKRGPFYSNFNLTILDCAKVTFGARVIIGPGVHVYAATHSTEIDERMAGYERAYPVEIGDDCWIGGNVVICGPCNIGKGPSLLSSSSDHSLMPEISAGVTVASCSFVRGDFPDYCVIGGTPARILKRLQPPSQSADLDKYRPLDITGVGQSSKQ